ncbi:LysR family transcriptional regulator [uncultured Neptuniibacter sp.]|uniref:LysR family transcriptional regulator n=1 Tax=uncultured Neptuniibacter sp. TaxID=502143 RepID=UPI002601A524|nr:LysR family transcriptional regulator [uncultured Neptuniibacter sp.]
MEILGLRTFKAVVDEGGIKGASAKLNTVQSNITSRIQKLEDELGSKLFTLVGRKLVTTPSGQLLYDYANQILQLEYQATSAISEITGSYDLRVGVPETFAAVHMPLVLKSLKQSHPEIHPKIYTDTSAKLVMAVLNNRVDCAMVGDPQAHKELVIVPVVDEELVIVTPLDGEYDSVLFVREDGCGYRKCALSWQQASGRSEDGLMVMSSSDGVLGCVAAGLGYTVIGRNMVTGSRYEKALRSEPVNVGVGHVRISMVYRRGNPLESGINNLVQLFPYKRPLQTDRPSEPDQE